ncbi:MAG TPA: DnaJ domain-containing protein [Acidimicrobiales bacterium]
MATGGAGFERGYNPTYYQVLGVVESASAKEIRAAYRQQARRRHPDAGGSEAEMQELNVAWTALRDPAKRALYDQFLAARRRSIGARKPEPATPLWAAEWTEVVEELSEDLLDDRPLRSTYAPEGWWALLPPATLMLAVAFLLGAFFFTNPTLLVFSGLAFFVAFGLFVMAPMWAMTRRRPPRR